MLNNQMLKALWDENRSKIYLVLLLIFCVLGMQLWLNFWLDPNIEKSRNQLLNKQNRLSLAQKLEEEGGGAKIIEITEDLEAFYQIIPQQTGLGNFIGRLYSYAEGAGIDIEQISYAAKPLAKSRLLGYQLSFSVSGQYTQLKKFIHLLENSPSILILNKISLNSSKGEKDQVVGLRMELNTFFQRGVR